MRYLAVSKTKFNGYNYLAFILSFKFFNTHIKVINTNIKKISLSYSKQNPIC